MIGSDTHKNWTRADGGACYGVSSTAISSEFYVKFRRHHVVVSAVCVLAAGFVFAQTKQDDADEHVFDLGDGITPPRLIHQVMPRHVKGSQGFRVGGAVLVGLVVTSKGLPKDVHVLKSLDKDVDQSAVEAVREWRFDPAKKNDKAVAVNISVEIRFHDM